MIPSQVILDIDEEDQQALPSWDLLREAQLSSSVYSQISFAWKGQLREAQLSNSILSQISFAQKTQNPAMFQNQGNWSLIHPFSKLSLQINFKDA